MPLWQRTPVIVGVFVVVAVIASLDKYHRSSDAPDRTATQYNNYVIYSNAALHLADGQDLYREYPAEQFDLYLYSPTFAALFYPLAVLPDVVGLCCWNALNAALLALALCALPAPHRWTACMAYFVIKDLLTNLQNAQANGLMAALMILTFVLWRRNQLAGAALCLALSAFIKPFGLAAGIFWILFDRRLRFVGCFAASVLVLGALPLVLTSPESLGDQYASWLARLQVMHSLSAGDSVMGILEAWFGLTDVKLTVVGLGLVAQLAPLMRRSQWTSDRFQLSVLASTLIWVVIFNHEAESPTFVIAAAGVVIWFFSQPVTRTNLSLGIVALVLMSFGSTDLMPEYLQTHFIAPLHLKALPGVLIWLKLQGELWTASYIPADKGQPLATLAAPSLARAA